MQAAGQRVKVGQEARLLNNPATDCTYGAFDNLHGLADGRACADSMKQSTNQFYGVEARVCQKMDYLY
jgi:putative DNA primase/helicase